MSQTNPITQAFAATLADELAHHAPELAALLELAPEAIVTRLAERPVLAAALVSLVGRPLEVDGQSLQIVTGYVDSLQQITIAGGYVERIIGKVINFYLPPAPRVIDLAAAQELLAALPTETLAPVAPLPEQHHMPFARNPNFVGREADLVALAYALKGEGATAAIGSAAATTGLGGVGKTNLATEFAHRYGQFFAGGLFWLSFADPESIPLEIAACGMALDLPGFADLKLDDQVRRVRSAWAQSIPRLLIFDNCDETEPGRAEALIQQWRPTTGGCRVLITSRRGVWSASMGVTTLPLGVLNRAESIALLRKHRPDLAVDDPALDAIAVELGDLPLALHLAGSYLENYRDSAEFGDPTTFLSELRDTRLLDHEALQGVDSTPSPTNHELHVARTFALSYERLVANEQADAQALRLLARVAYLAPGNIVPRDLALATLMLEEEDRTGRRQAERGLRELLSLGLIEREGDDSLRMHRLVGAYVRQASADAGAQSMVEHMVTCVAGASSDASTPLAFINVFLPILRGVTDAALDRDKYAATLCARLGLYLDRLGSYASAQHYVEHALAISERVLGAEHSQTIIILNNLALLYKKQENFAAALPLYERALAVTEQTLGVDHPQTIISLNNLAEFYRAQGNYDAALPMLEHISVISERVLGIEHPDTIKSLNNLAGIYYEQGNCVLAQHLLERVMEFFDRVHGDSHPDTALSLNNLGMLHAEQGNYVVAFSLLERAVEIRERVLGAAHPDTALSLNNLAILHFEQGNHSKALSLFERALAIIEHVFGSEHSQVSICLNNLASMYNKQKNYAAAIPLYERALAINERVLGSEHISTATSLHNLAELHNEQGNLQAAEPLMSRALQILESQLGITHPKTQRIRQHFRVLQQQINGYPVHVIDLSRDMTNLISDIVSVSNGYNISRPPVIKILFQLEQNGVMLREPVERIWAGDRELEVLVDGLDDICTEIIKRVLDLIATNAANRQISPSCSKDISMSLIQSMPLPIIEALEHGDDGVLQKALADLPEAQRAEVITQLKNADILRREPDMAKMLRQFERLLRDIARVAMGDTSPRSAVEAALSRLEQEGWRLSAIVQQIWNGERDEARLICGVDAKSALLVQRILKLIRTTFSVQEEQQYLCERFDPLLADIAAIANGDDAPREQVTQALAQLAQNGWMLRGPVERIWAGERDRAALVAGLDEQDAALIERMLELIHTPASVAQVPLPPAPPDVVLSPSILAALASNDAAQLEAALAILAPDERTRVEAQLRAEAERVMQELTRRSSEEIVAGLPAAVRAALEQQDSDAIQAAMAALADNDRQRVMVDLGALRAHAVRAAQQQQQDPLERFAPLLEAIAAVANGDDAPRELVMQVLAQLGQSGWMLRGPVERIWVGERDRAALVASLDEQDAALIERVLELIHTPASVAQVPLPPAPPDVVLSPSILAALASNDVAQLKVALAALSPDERTRVEAQLRAEAERVMQELTRRSPEEIVAGLPAAVRAALEQQDSDAIQVAMAALADNDRQRVMVDLGALRAHAVRAAQQQQQDPLERFAPLLEAIAAVANGDDAPRKLVTQTLAQLEQNGWMLRGPVERIWAGERDRAALVAGLDEQDAALIERMLELIHTPASVAQVPLPPAPPDVVLSPSILAALASNDVAQLKAALAALAPDERTRVEAQLRAEAERVMQELTPRSPEEIVAGLPAAVRAALQQQDNDAFQLEMGAFAEEERPMPPEAEASPLTTARAGIRCARWPALLAGAGGVATVGLLGAAGLAPLLAGLGAGALATGPVVEWFTSMGMNALAGWVGNLATDGMWAVLDDDDPDPAWLAELAQCLAAAAASDQALAAELATFLKELDAVPLALASIAEEQEAQSDVLIEQHRLLQRLSADMERLKLAGGALGPVVVAESDRVIATNIDCTKSHFAQLRAELTAIRDAQRHAIDVLHRVESIALLRQHRPELLDAEADALAAELGDLPLALHLAGRFLADLAKCWSVDRYLAELRSSRLFDRLLLLERGGTLPTDHNRDVARSFALSYERLELQDAEDALALKLLARAAHLVPGEVLPTALLLATIAQPVDDADGDRLAEAALDRLVALGLIEREGDDSLRMHRLVGAYVRHVSADGEAQSAVEQVVIRVAGNMVDVPILATLNAFIPILRGITDAALGREDARVVSLCSWIGRHLQRLGSYASAQPYVERALALSEQVLGAEHPDTAQSLNNLAWLYRVQGNYGAALPLYERALPLSEQVLGADHPQTVQVLTNLAWLYEAQGNYGAALPLYERALPLSEHVLGVDHPQTVIIFTKLAGLYEAQGNYDAALPLSQRALVIYERVLGVDHPQTVISLINLAGLYCRQENYEAALPLAERALPLSEQVLGGDHSQTFTILLNLAWLYREQRNYEAALPLYERTLEICERVWGVEHPQTIQRLTGLAGLYEEQENYGAALPLYERALAIREQVLGAEHPDTAQSLNNLAWLYRVQGNYGAALPLYERALPLSEHVLGADHPQTVEVLTNLAWLYRAQGNYGAALPLSERALAIREQVLGAEHPDTATSLNNLAGLYEAQGNYGAALPLYERALAIRERVLGAEHPGVATSLNNLAVLHAHRGGFVTAIPLIERALNIRQRTLGGQHPDTLATEQSLVNMRRAAQQQQQDPLERFVPLLAAIAAVAKGDDAPREQVTQALTQLEQNGWMLRGPVERIWAGERARAMLVAGLDEQDAALIERVLRLL